MDKCNYNNPRICRYFVSFHRCFPCDVTRCRSGDFGVIFVTVFKIKRNLFIASGSVPLNTPNKNCDCAHVSHRCDFKAAYLAICSLESRTETLVILHVKCVLFLLASNENWMSGTALNETSQFPCTVHSPTNALFYFKKHIKIYIKIHINIAPTCFGLRPSSGSPH